MPLVVGAGFCGVEVGIAFGGGSCPGTGWPAGGAVGGGCWLCGGAPGSGLVVPGGCVAGFGVGVAPGTWAKADWLPISRNTDTNRILNNSRGRDISITPKTPSQLSIIILKTTLTLNKQVSFDQVFTTLLAPSQFQKDGPGPNLTLKATPHNLGLLYSQQVSILVWQAAEDSVSGPPFKLLKLSRNNQQEGSS